MGFQTYETLFQNYTEKYVTQKYRIPGMELPRINSVMTSQWAKDQPWYPAYQKAMTMDFSQFEQVPPLARNFLATLYMNELMHTKTSGSRPIEAGKDSKLMPMFHAPALGRLFSVNDYEYYKLLKEQEAQMGEAEGQERIIGNAEDQRLEQGVRTRMAEMERYLKSEKHNPLFRLGCSMFARKEESKRSQFGEKKDAESRNMFRELDDRMTEMIMEDTLSPMSQQQIQATYKMAEDQKTADEMVQTNVEKQVQVAKMMFLAHIGRTFLTTTTANENGEPQPVEQNLDRSVASMVSHCSRTGFVLPPGEENQVNEMMDSILGSNAGRAAGIYGRTAATHSTQNGANVREYKELKGVCLRKQYGMDIAIGGLGNPGVMKEGYQKQTLKNDGTCGHMYLHINKGTAGKTSSLLVGFESDAPEMTNQMGHTHTKSATQESMSSFLGQRDDEMGDKYGGRTVDCTMYDPAMLKNMLDSFANRYRSMMFEAVKSGTMKSRVQEINQMLSGKIMDADRLEVLFNKTGFTKQAAAHMAIQVAERRNLMSREALEAKKNQSRSLSATESEVEVAPMEENKKPGYRMIIKAAFGNQAALNRLREYKRVFDVRATKVRMEFRDLLKETEVQKKTMRHRMIEHVVKKNEPVNERSARTRQ